jgi:flagellar hook-associated protein 2
VDGFPSGDWIERPSNTVTDIITGLSLSFKAAGTATISVTRDVEGVKGKVSNLVDAFNAVVSYIKEESRYDPETGEKGALLSDYGTRFIHDELQQFVVSPAPGFLDGEETYTLLAQIGVSLGAGGLLTVDEDELDEALQNDLDAAVALVSASFSGISDSQYLRYGGCSTLTTTPGIYEVEAFFSGGVLTSGRMRTSGTTTWHDATVQDNLLLGAEDTPEEGLRVQATWDGSSSTQSAVVRLRHGLAGGLSLMLEKMLRFETGTTAVLKQHQQDIVASLDRAIEREEARLARFEEHLREKFARLEYLMSELQAQGAALLAQLEQL